MYNLIVLGAGFSRAAGLPLGNELFSEIVREAKRDVLFENILKPDMERYLLFIERTEGVTLHSDEIELEQFMSFLDVEHALGFEGSDTWSDEGNKSQVLVRHLIARTLYSRQRRMSHGASGLYERFASRLEPGDRIITFNYDTLVEEALLRVGKPFRLVGGRYSQVDEWGATWADGPDDEIILLKMHGSIDWFSKKHFIQNRRFRRRAGLLGQPQDPVFNNREIRLRKLVRGPYWRGSPLKSVYRVQDLGPYFAEAQPLLGPTPLLVSPSYSKILYLKPLEDFWADSASAGSLNGTLAIIGYSLPLHDNYVRQALYAAVRNFQYYDTGELIPKTNIRLVDLRSGDAAQEAYRSIYRFVDWNRADVCFNGFGDEAIEMVFAA